MNGDVAGNLHVTGFLGLAAFLDSLVFLQGQEICFVTW